MSIEEYLKLMQFPSEWEHWNMLPNKDWFKELINTYEPGNENASEHDRNGAFHWWLRKEPTEEQLIKLVKLSFLDPEPLMAGDVRNYIRKAKNFTKKVESEINNAI